MTETGWSHLSIVAIMVVPLLVIWLDLRYRQGNMHRENESRLTRIETMMEPVWKWFNNGRHD